MRFLRLMCTAVLLGVFLSLADPALTHASDSTSTELWTDVGLRLEVSEKVNATFTQLLRFDDKMSRRYLVAPELSIGYKPMDWWRLEGGYRYEYRRDNDAVFQDRYRVFANTRLLAKFKPVSLGLRIQWQKKFRQEEDDGTPTRHNLRTRVKAKLRCVPKVNPYASVELFQRIDGLDDDVPAGTVQKLRFGLGVEWQRGPIECDARYYLGLPTHDDDDLTRHVLSVGIRFDLAP